LATSFGSELNVAWIDCHLEIKRDFLECQKTLDGPDQTPDVFLCLLWEARRGGRRDYMVRGLLERSRPNETTCGGRRCLMMPSDDEVRDLSDYGQTDRHTRAGCIENQFGPLYSSHGK
jgi:hypothetical protein